MLHTASPVAAGLVPHTPIIGRRQLGPSGGAGFGSDGSRSNGIKSLFENGDWHLAAPHISPQSVFKLGACPRFRIGSKWMKMRLRLCIDYSVHSNSSDCAVNPEQPRPKPQIS
jgi:hypothetical protein